MAVQYIPDFSTIKISKQYRPLLLLNDAQTIDFVSKSIDLPNWYSSLYRTVIYLFALLFLGYSIFGFITGTLSLRLFSVYLSGGLVIGSTFIVVVHEWIQAMYYRFCGAKSIQYQLSLKRLSFIVRAANHVVSKRQFEHLVFLPFCIVNALLLLTGLFIVPHHFLFFVSMALVHSLYCVRDFALLAYLMPYQDFLTFDDAKENTFVYGNPLPRAVFQDNADNALTY